MSQLQAASGGGFSAGLRLIPFNALMRRRRRACGMTQTELARRVSCSGAMISHVETLRAWPSKTLQAAIAQTLRCPVAMLFPTWVAEAVELKAWASRSIEATIEEPVGLASGLVTQALTSGAVDENMEKQVENSLLLKEARHVLRPLEEQVITYVFDEGLTHRETAELMGVTASRIGQLKQAALKRLRRELRPMWWMPL